ncbi:DedA family protein [Planosporangium flavigriseum]|uniref:Membrane protein n=1 Tax=Planosporangium flavigriseum TaxID=373681 RepID=A0A8J3LKC2_9ACTN|nr:VTT domain-containing protein [Planosporangium flavigriseum]GIG73402.1 membrane protein [Planosporangium flavigriseum]
MHAFAAHAASAVNPLDAKSVIQAFGLVGVLVILFAETGLMIGFFLPGDSLLFIAGIAASPVAADIVGVQLSLPVLLVGAPICAIVGAQLGHVLGARYGRRLFTRPDSRLFRTEYVDRAEYYFNKYGPAKAVMLARFVPVVRTFLNPVAGMLQMPARRFLLWNVIGGLLWTDAIVLVGYLPARKLRDTIGAANIDKYLLPVVVLIVLLSLIPILIEIVRSRRDRTHAATPDRVTDRTAPGPRR